ncbi:glycogen phosphorylase [Escherichia coli]|uniref:Glycogen phosphorylase n=1 Tax=Escherichia coli TaxID=562 RepID=A0A376WRB4_ECOLX|nr:glycogen phosphorylase [Escherichia coli]
MNAPFTYSSPTLSVEALKHSIAYKLMFTIGKDPVVANKHEWLNATLFAVRDRLVERWLRQTVPSCRKKLVRFTTCRWSF